MTLITNEQYYERRKALDTKLKRMGVSERGRAKLLRLADQMRAVQQGLAKVKPPSRGKGQ